MQAISWLHTARRPVLRYSLGYTLLFAALAFANRYDLWLNLPPVSIHQWRQADGAALAWHYAQNPDFSEPTICNLFYIDDAHAVGELPLLYWTAGLVTRFFGAPYPLRRLGLCLLFGGGWAFGWVLLRQTRRPAVASLGAGLLLTSPILGYYGPNTLPDAPAFCFVLLAMAALFQAERTQRTGRLWAAAGLAATAVSLKLSMAIGPLALLSAGWLERRSGRLPPGSIWSGPRPWVAAAAAICAVAGLRWWIAAYNAEHHAFYFLASIRPIWNYGGAFIGETLGLIATTGLPVYASAGLYLASLGCLWLTLEHWKSTPVLWRNFFTFTLWGCAAYAVLWFRMLREHDYYVLCLLILPAFLLLHGLPPALSRFSARKITYALALCWLLGLGHSHWVLSKRLDLAVHPRSDENLPPSAFLPPGCLERAGIPLSARVLCPQDPSPNIAPLALQRQGWTGYNFADRINADTLRKYQAKFGLSHLALRDSARYNPLYRQFFPRQVFAANGWYLYAR